MGKKQKIFNYISIIIIFCLGFYYLGRLIHFKILNDKKIVYSDLMAEQIKQKINKYEVTKTLINENNTYRFANNAKNNYVKYMGYIWRIIKVNTDNTITMITEDSIISLSYGNGKNYIDSQINNWLNEKDTGIFYKSLNTNYLTNNNTCLDKFNSIENISCNDINNENYISLLSVDDYSKAGSSNSFLNNGLYFWTTNNSDNNQFWYVSKDGKIGLSDNDIELGIRPVVTLKNDTIILKGNGTNDDPYIIEEHNPKTLAEVYIGQYLKLNDSLWRVVDKNKNSIKVVSEEYIKKDGNFYEIYYSNYNNSSDITNKNSLLYYLNNTYYNEFIEKDLIVKGLFYDGAIDDNYQTLFNSSITAYVGLLSIAEPFVYDVGNVFTLSRKFNNELGIYIIDENKRLFEDKVENIHYVRPAIYVTNKANIKKGNGTYLNPYIIGDDNNEKN